VPQESKNSNQICIDINAREFYIQPSRIVRLIPPHPTPPKEGGFMVPRFVLLLLLLPLPALSQVLTGRVTSGGNPLIGANVVVRGTTIGAATDVEGRYRLSLNSGRHEISFSFLGYARRTEIVVLAQNEEKVLNVELQPQAVESKDIVVVVGARASGRTVTDSPVPIDVFSFQELQYSGQASFDKVLQYRVPSFNTSQTPVNDATALLDPWEIRNMGVSRTLILINGKRKNLSALVYTQTSPSRGETATDISAIPLDAIKRVEILRDGASAQY
jgi:iron complex outermembrane receptor protein